MRSSDSQGAGITTLLLVCTLLPILYIVFGVAVLFIRLGDQGDWPAFMERALQGTDDGWRVRCGQAAVFLVGFALIMLWPLFVIYTVGWWVVYGLWAAMYVFGAGKEPGRRVVRVKKVMECGEAMPLPNTGRRAMAAAERGRRHREERAAKAGNIELGTMENNGNGNNAVGTVERIVGMESRREDQKPMTEAWAAGQRPQLQTESPQRSRVQERSLRGRTHRFRKRKLLTILEAEEGNLE